MNIQGIGNATQNLSTQNTQGLQRNAAATPEAVRKENVSSTAQPTKQDVQDAAKKISEFVNPINSSLEFSVDEDSGVPIVKIIDKGSKEVLRQLPSKEAIQIAKALDEIDKLQGLLVSNKA